MAGWLTVHDASGRGLSVPVVSGRTLAQVVYVSGEWEAPALCSGVGRCGLCRMRFLSQPPQALDEEVRLLGQDAVDDGWRLGCRHLAVEGIEVEIPARPRVRAANGRGHEAGEPLCLAVDLGTTSVHWSALRGGQRVASGVFLNPQMGAGSEIMSRLAFARSASGAEAMRRLVVEQLLECIAQLPSPVARIALAGNPAMTSLLLERPSDGLCAAPYCLSHLEGEIVRVAPGVPPAYVFPHIGPFIGGDITAGMAWLLSADTPPEYPFLFADMGTNGEFLLALSPTEFLAASVPLGPALEGVGLDCGTVAAPGAVTSFALTPRGLQPRRLGAGTTRGISGTGYLSLLSQLRSSGMMDAGGQFSPGATPLARSLARGLHTVDGEARLDLGEGLYLSASDVEEVLKVKAAFNLAFARLLRGAGRRAHELAGIYLAGALGEHVPPRALETLGFLPPGASARVTMAGNTALAGAERQCADIVLRETARDVSTRAKVLELAEDAQFSAQYLACMTFDHVTLHTDNSGL